VLAKPGKGTKKRPHRHRQGLTFRPSDAARSGADSSKIYQYLNFDKIEEFSDAAATVGA